MLFLFFFFFFGEDDQVDESEGSVLDMCIFLFKFTLND